MVPLDHLFPDRLCCDRPYCLHDKALRGKSGLVHETCILACAIASAAHKLDKSLMVIFTARFLGKVNKLE